MDAIAYEIGLKKQYLKKQFFSIAEKMIFWAVLFLFLLFGSVSRAETTTVHLVSAKQSKLIERFQNLLKKESPELNVDFINIKALSETKLNFSDIYILVGKQMLRANEVNHFSEKHNVMAVMVTHDQVEKNSLIDNAVFFEPPLERQMALASVLFPSSNIGLLAKSPMQQTAIEKQLKQFKLAFSIENIAGKDLNQALYHILKRSDLLVAAYDVELYSPKNIKNILVTSYRQSKVLIGPSKAYLKAGAYASTYSSLDDVAKRVDEIVQYFKKTGKWLSSGYNPYYHIKINNNVARSLGLPQHDVKEVKKEVEEFIRTKGSGKKFSSLQGRKAIGVEAGK